MGQDMTIRSEIRAISGTAGLAAPAAVLSALRPSLLAGLLLLSRP
jgi:hypothetical protein